MSSASQSLLKYRSACKLSSPTLFNLSYTYFQEWGKAPREPSPGDVVNIAPEVKHWHGAAPDSWFSHLSIEVQAEGA